MLDKRYRVVISNVVSEVESSISKFSSYHQAHSFLTVSLQEPTLLSWHSGGRWSIRYST